MTDGSITVVTLVSLPLGYMLVKPVFIAWAKRLEARAATPSLPDTRLERMEQAIESIAIEVERISEAQRFTTKLLTDRGSDRESLPRAVSGGQSR